VRSGKDPDVFIDPAVGPMTEEAAALFNSEQAKLSRVPFWYGTEANKDAISAYFERNGVQIVTAEMILRAAERLRQYGLLEERPAESEPIQELEAPETPETLPARQVAAELMRSFGLQPPSEPTQETVQGIDPTTGLERRYTQREVDRMSSAQYKEA